MFLPASRQFRFFWFARTASFAGDQIGQTALIILAARGGAAHVVAMLLAVTLPRVLGPLLGPLADIYPMRSLMLAMDVVQFTLFLSLAVFSPPFAIVVGIAALATLSNTIFLPAGRKSYPRMLQPDQFPSAARAMALCFNVGFAAGPALGGAMSAALGVRLALAVDALTFVMSAALLLRTPKMSPDPNVECRQPYRTALGAGMRAIASSRTLRVLLPSSGLLLAFAALDNAALPLLAHQQLRGSAGVYGYLLSTFGLGMVAGSFLGGRLGRRGSAIESWGVSQALFGLGTVVTGIGPIIALAFVGQFVAGLGNGAGNVSSEILLQREVQPSVLGTASSVTTAVPFVSSSLSYLAAGVILSLVSPSVVLLVAGVGVFATLSIVARPLRRVMGHVPASG